MTAMRSPLTRHLIAAPSCLILWAQHKYWTSLTTTRAEGLSIKGMEACRTAVGSAGCGDDAEPPFEKRPAAGFPASREQHHARMARRHCHHSYTGVLDQRAGIG